VATSGRDYAVAAMTELPSGTVTFLFSDIEGSTRMLRDLGERYGALLERHNRLIGEAVEQNGGKVFGSEGDAVFAAFDRPAAGLAAAVGAQRGLAAADWPGGVQPRVRMGIHTGEVTRAGDSYVGMAIHHVARLTAAGHGGQILVSEAARQLTSGALPEGTELRDLGEHRLKDLPEPERIHQLVVDGLPDRFPALRSLGGRPNNLPPQLTSFVGRAELAEARRLLEATRLLTLTGPGGTGKTRLSLELANEAVERHADGVYFVALDAVTDPNLVPSTIAGVLELPEGSEPPLERLLNHLRDREVLLVLDNLEQVIEVGSTVARLLREAPRLRLIATSRVPLRISGEQEFAVPPLTIPEADGAITATEAARYAAVRLFVERAMAVKPAFALTDDNAADAVEIVRSLDGLPLAIELAAARVRILPLAALRERLDQRLGLLVGGGRDLPTRQQTLRGAIDWSHDLLEAGERRLFARLAVFAGGAWLAQAEQVCGPADEVGGEVLDLLASLTEKSLVRSLALDDLDPRFGMLATIREYAQEKLAASGEEDAVRERHAAAYVELIERCSSQLTGDASRRWLDRLEHDHDNLRSALDRAVGAGNAALALRLIAAIWRFWQIRGHLHEASERIDRVFAMPGAADAPDALLARAHGAAGSVAYWRFDGARTRLHYDAAVRHARLSGDSAVLAEALYNSGFRTPLSVESIPEDLERATAAFEESLELYRSLGDRYGVASVLWGLANASLARRDYELVRARLGEALELHRELRNPFGLGWTVFMVAITDLMERHDDAAAGRMREAMEIFRSTADTTGIAMAIGGFAVMALRSGDLERGWTLSGAVEGLRRSAGVALSQNLLQEEDIRVPEAPPDGDEGAAAAWNRGLHTPLEDAIGLALDGQMSEAR
jgi:predicted ATPase/class 3 adenylate cyclase